MWTVTWAAPWGGGVAQYSTCDANNI
jgi:hypothetical protein